MLIATGDALPALWRGGPTLLWSVFSYLLPCFYLHEVGATVCTVDDIVAFLETFAPTELAEEWDNVGLLVGDRAQPVRRVMTCLTVTDDSVDEAVSEGADLLVSHHPLPFRPLRRITTETVPGRLLWKLIRAGIAVYSPHTAFDSARQGINQRLAEGLGLLQIAPLLPHDADAVEPGTGRWGRFVPALPLASLAERVKSLLRVEQLQLVGQRDQPVERLAIGCGSAGELLEAARQHACDAMLLGETRWHTCVEAAAHGVALILPGHYSSERFAIEQLADVLSEQFAELQVWASRREHDPLWWF